MLKKLAITIGIVLVLGLGYAAIFGFRATRVPAIQKLVATNARIGGSPGEILQFLDNQQLEHSQLKRPTAMSLGPGYNYSNLPIIVAIKRHTMSSLFVSESIEIVFVFDEQNELKRFDVVPILTSF